MQAGAGRVVSHYELYVSLFGSLFNIYIYVAEYALTNRTPLSSSLSPPVARHPLRINVAERASNGAHGVPNGDDILVRVPQVDDVVERGVAAGWVVVEGDGAADGVGTRGDVLVLPRPPHAVDHRVVQPEGRIARRREQVAARVAVDRHVPARVRAEEAVGEVALHQRLEGRDVRVRRDEGGCVEVGRPLRRHPDVDVAAQATRVQPEAVRLRVGCEVLVGWRDGAEADGKVLEGAGGYAAAALGGRDGDEGRGGRGDVDRRVFLVCAIAAYGGFTAVEYG